MVYELSVQDDGDVSVKKLSKKPALPTNTILENKKALTEYLTSVIELRYPLKEVLSRIGSAEMFEETTFKQEAPHG